MSSKTTYSGNRVSDRGKVKSSTFSLSIQTREDGNPFYNNVLFVDHGDTLRKPGMPTIEFMFFSIRNPDAVKMAKEILMELAPECLK